MFPKALIRTLRKALRFPLNVFRKSVVLLHRHLKHPEVILRPNSTDVRVYYSVFIEKEFNLHSSYNPITIIDAGAYIGLSAIYFAEKYSKARIIALEPEASNFASLEKNTNHIKNIECVNGGLWSSDSHLKIHDRGTGNWGFAVTEVPQQETWDVLGYSIEKIMSDYGLEKIDILKIDIEGSEKELFSKNYESWLKKVNIIMIELHDRINPGCSKAVFTAADASEWKREQRGEKVILTRRHFV